MGGALNDLVSAPDLWRGTATSVVAADAVALARTAVGGTGRRRAVRWGPPILSVGAAFAAYVCVPDTERALWLLGAGAGAAAVALLLRLRWEPAALLVTIGLVWVAIEDGPPRTSALIGTLSIAVLHVVLQHRVHVVPAGGPVLSVLALATLALLLAARVAGRGGGWVRPFAEALLIVVATTAAARRVQPAPVRR